MTPRHSPTPLHTLRRMTDALVWSSLWTAACATLLLGAASRALGLTPAPALLVLAGCGACIVYSVDRLRDRARDHPRAPLRSAFVARHRLWLRAQTALAALGALWATREVGPRVLALAALVALAGLFHRRLKAHVWLKPLYISAGWTTVAVGFPLAAATGVGAGATESIGARAAAPGVAWLVAVTLLANVLLTNLCDDEGLAARWGERRTLRAAGALCALAALAPLSGAAAFALLALPGALACTLPRWRASERRAGYAVDGAIGAGSALAWLLLASAAPGG